MQGGINKLHSACEASGCTNKGKISYALCAPIQISQLTYLYICSSPGHLFLSSQVGSWNGLGFLNIIHLHLVLCQPRSYIRTPEKNWCFA